MVNWWICRYAKGFRRLLCSPQMREAIESMFQIAEEEPGKTRRHHFRQMNEKHTIRKCKCFAPISYGGIAVLMTATGD